MYFSTLMAFIANSILRTSATICVAVSTDLRPPSGPFKTLKTDPEFYYFFLNKKAVYFFAAQPPQDQT